MISWLLIPALAGNIGLALYALFLDKDSRVNRAFAALTFSLSVWVFGAALQGIILTSDWHDVALFGVRVVYTGVLLVFLSFFYFTRFFPKERSTYLDNRSLVYFTCIVLVLFLGVIWSPYFVSDARQGSFGFYEIPGPAYPIIYLIVLGISLLYLDLLVLYFNSSSDLDKRRLTLILLGGVLPLALGAGNIFFISTGRGGHPFFILPLAPLSTLVSVCLYYYGITKYRILFFKGGMESEALEKRRFELSHETIYVLFEEHRVKTIEVFTDLISHGFTGILVTPSEPDGIRAKYGIQNTPIIWMTERKKPNTHSCECINPKNLDLLFYAIRDYVESQGDTVVCITQFDVVTSMKQQKEVMSFMEKIIPIATRGDTIFILHFKSNKEDSKKTVDLLPDSSDLTEIFRIQDDIERLRAMILNAERKYRKRELNQKVFEEIMRDYEEQLIGLEVDYNKLVVEAGYKNLSDKDFK